MNNVIGILADNISLVTWIPTILFIIIVVIGILFGMLRGFRKSLLLFTNFIICFTLSFILCAFILNNNDVQQYMVKFINIILPGSLQSMLGVSESAGTISAMVVEWVGNALTSVSDETYNIMTPYIITASQILQGFLYFVVFLVLYLFLSIFSYIGYLIFFRQGRYKQKIHELYENGIRKKDYKKRFLLGGLVGTVKGLIVGVLFLSVLGSMFFIVSGGSYDHIEDGEEVKITINGKVYDLTDYYKLIDSYGNSFIPKTLESLKDKNDFPMYLKFMTSFTTSDLIIKEDNIKQKINVLEEVGYLTNVMHQTVMFADKYNINLSSKKIVSEFKRLFNEEEKFEDDLFAIITSLGKSPLQRTLGKTISIHFNEIYVAEGIKNKYLDIMFTGENALLLSDLGSKEDVRVFIDILSDVLELYEPETSLNMSQIVADKGNVI
ncbi:MAG: hypothetical protein ACRC5M_05230, partial [Anaeroplasmataceae bacterium]